MKYVITLLLSLALLSSCSFSEESNKPPEDTSKIDNCPELPSQPPKIDVYAQKYVFYKAFNYQIEDITADLDTIAFESSSHKFTLCRANNNWIVESINAPGSDSSNNTQLEQYRYIQLQGKTYQYGVKLDRQNPREAQRVIFELTTPKSNQPRQQILYTLEQTKQAQAGAQLGDPEISEPIVYGDRLFWHIYTYHGEGFGGIATIVSYDRATNKITVIKPPEIATQIINDLVIAGQPDDPTFSIATQLSGEGNPDIPTMGLVAYRPNNEDYTQGSIESYRVDNSPIVGAIPTKLYLEEEILWVGTGNGICQVEWQTIDRPNSWSCWRFALMAELQGEEIPIYSSSLDNTPDTTITPDNSDLIVEVLWWSPYRREPLKGRYEIRHNPGMTVELSDRGAATWSELYQGNYQSPVWQPPVYWAGSNWHWEGDRFVRGFDEVELNAFGGGPMGIGSQIANDNYSFDTNAIRGDLELLELTKNTTKVKYYSAWVEDGLLQPYLTIIPQNIPAKSKPNPLLEIKSSLD